MALEKRVEAVEGKLEHVIVVLDRMVERQAQLDNVMAILAGSMETLAESHIKTQEQLQELAASQREGDQRLRETIRELDERLSARIDKLVSGIGEFMRRESDSKPN